MKNEHFRSYDEYVERQKEKQLLANLSSKAGLKREHNRPKTAGKRSCVREIRKDFSSHADPKVLILGARWGSDVLLFRECGYSSIAAFDLFDPPLTDLVSYGDAHFLTSFLSDKYDIVWAHHVFEHFFKPSKVLEELRAVTTDCAMLYLELPFFDGREDRYDAQDEFDTPDEFIHLVESHGFGKVRHRESTVQLKGSGDVGKYIYYVFRKKGTE